MMCFFRFSSGEKGIYVIFFDVVVFNERAAVIEDDNEVNFGTDHDSN